MKAKILLTVNEEQKEVMFREPSWREATIWRKEIARLSSKINEKFLYFFNSNTDTILDRHEKLMGIAFVRLLELNTDGTFKSVDDFYNLPASEGANLFLWLVKVVSPLAVVPIEITNGPKQNPAAGGSNNIYR